MNACANVDKSPVRLLVADDHRAVRQSITRLLSQSSDVLVAGEASNGVEVIEKLRDEPFDLVLLDITMPGKNGLDVLRDVKREWPQLPVIILSVHPPEEYKARAMVLGAAGYVTKDRAGDELLAEVRRATGLV
jgi:two-component system invasion response regulator UvrY